MPLKLILVLQLSRINLVREDFNRSVAAHQRRAVREGLDELYTGVSKISVDSSFDESCPSNDSSVDDAPPLAPTAPPRVITSPNYSMPPNLSVPASPGSPVSCHPAPPAASVYYSPQSIPSQNEISPTGVANFDFDHVPLQYDHCMAIPPTPAILLRINNYQKTKIVCQVQFKHNFRYCMVTVPSKLIRNLKLGDFVITEGEKNQEDLGVITNAYSVEDFHLMRSYVGLSQDAEENVVGNILRLATMAERAKLPKKMLREESILHLCQELAREKYHLLANIYGVEYQFDGLKLSVYYTSDARVDYREFAQDLFNRFRTKIWMRKTNQCSVFIPKPFATMALQTGNNPF